MSGRSAYVRKQKAPGRHEQAFAPRLPSHPPSPQYAWQSEPFMSGRPSLEPMAEQSPYDGPQHYVPALNIIDFDYDRPPPAVVRPPSRARANSSHGRTTTSMSSWSSTADASTSQPSRIEKSALRAFVDSKSEALRSKLAFRSAPRQSSSDQLHHGRPNRSGASSRSPFSSYSSTSIHHHTSFEAPPSSRSRTPPDRIRMAPAHDVSSVVEPCATLSQGGARYSEHLSSVKRWTGGGKLPQPWSKLRKDPELWDPTGDTLVYLGHEAHGLSRPGPSLRVHSSVLEDTGSAFFTTILREGFVHRHDYDLQISPQSPMSGSYMSNPDGSRETFLHLGRRESNTSMLGPHPGTRVPLPGLNSLRSHGGQPTPPTSESSSRERDHEHEHSVLYELFFPAPLDASTVEILRHHLTTRNVFALLFGKSLVGLNLYQSLLDLHERLQMYMPADSDNASLIIDHIVSNGVDDVRNDPASAAGLLAWSEGATVRWTEGWREAFVHCTGTYSRLKHAPEFRDVSHFSRILLERANLEVQVRVQQVADKLADFDFIDIWPMQSVMSPTARDAFDRFRRFLTRHYEAVFWSWPPVPRFGTADLWLTRDVIRRLQTDLGALYDYLVDRDMTWDDSPSIMSMSRSMSSSMSMSSSSPSPTPPRDRQQRRIVSKGLKPNYRPDGDGLPMTDMLIGFDNRHGFPHIPHPYPLLPPSLPMQVPSKPARFGRKPRVHESRFTERRIALEYSEATNVFRLGPAFGANSLVESFSNFERSDLPGEVDPARSRKGRWILIYGVLQLLATVSVDTPGLRHKDKVQYHVNPRLRGTPPWRDKRDPPPEEASHEHSHCWTVPRTWKEPEFGPEPSGPRKHKEMTMTGLSDHVSRRLSIADDQHLGARRDNRDNNKSNKDSQLREMSSGSDGSGSDESGTVSGGHNREKVTDWPIRNQSATRARALGQQEYGSSSRW